MNSENTSRTGLSHEEATAAVFAAGSMFEIQEVEIRGVLTKVFAGTPPNIRHLFALAAMQDDRDFLVYEDEQWKMSDVLDQAGQIGRYLVSEGVAKGDRVALAMRNFPEWITAFVAITSIGAVAVPLNAWWQTDELVFGLTDSGSKIAFVDSARLEQLNQVRDQFDAKLVSVRDDSPAAEGIDRLADVLDPEATMPEVEIDPDDNVSILYTSGTTGKPKGAVSTHRALLSALLSFAARAAVGSLQEPPAEEAPEEASTCFILAVPLFHVTGLVPVMLGTFVSGARLVIMYKWDPERALELIERERVTNFVGVPTMSWDLLESPSFDSTDTSSLRSVGGGGAPAPPELVHRIEDSFDQGRPGIGYGMTETNAYGPQNAGDDYVSHPTSTGRAVPTLDMRVTDDAGNPLGCDELGEIWFKGPNLISGYWNRPEATAETIVDGWLRTGDIGRIDADGFVYVVDRAKDMVLRGGENIYCAEVEAAIYEHPAVYEAAVYGLPHERLGEELAVTVMVKPGEQLEAAELQRHVRERLASFKVPTVVSIVHDQLPRNASGKILKRELRDAAARQGA